MDRRTFIAGGSAMLLFLPKTALAQRKDVPRIAYVSTLARDHPIVQSFRRALSDLGYVAGNTVDIAYFTYDREDQLRSIAPQVIANKPDVIMSIGTAPTLALKEATPTIPIVFSNVSSPVISGIVESMARPGANVTGVTILATEIAAKRLQLFTELVPGLAQVAALHNPDNPADAPQLAEVLVAGEAMGLDARAVAVLDNADWDSLMANLLEEGVDALYFVSDLIFMNNRNHISEAAIKHNLPTMFYSRRIVEVGGLMSYGGSVQEHYNGAARLVVRILEGAIPADLPVEQPTTFELAINLRTARALGITIPPKLLIMATELVE